MQETDYNFEDLIHDASFRRWVNGDPSLEEKHYWDKWVMKNPQNRALAKRAQQHVIGFSIKPSSQSAQDKAWNHIKHQLDGERDYHKSYRTDKSSISRSQWMFRAVAIFLLASLTGLAISLLMTEQAEQIKKNQIVDNEIQTGYGERKEIQLSDGSKIVLNANTRLSYTIDRANPSGVEVFLDGEAHFSVAVREDSDDIAFKVRTEKGLIRVMGTTFVVSTRDKNTQVVLEEGEVIVDPLNKDKAVILKPGQIAEIRSDSDTIHTALVNPQVYTSWTTYTLIFDETPFADVIARLENTFGVKVVVRNPDLYNRKLSGSIDNSSLEVITSALSNTLDIPISIADRAVYVGQNQSDN